MGISKQKYCKCGHEKEFHKNLNAKFSFATFCRQCPCSSYMNRNLPNKWSYGAMITTVCLGMLFVVLSSIMLIEADPKITGTQDKTITFTLGELHGILFLLFIAINVFFVMWFVVDPVLSVLSERKRRKFPIGDDNEKQ